MSKSKRNKVVGRREISAILRKSKGQAFTVCFRKRTGEKELRIMNARLGVKKGVTGKGMSYDPRGRSLMPVFEMSKKAFRMVDLTSVVWAKVNGTTYTVDA